MYRQVHIYFDCKEVVFAGRNCSHRAYHVTRASAGRLARVLHNLYPTGLLEVMPPSAHSLGVYYRVWDVKPKSPATL
jgi:hypothetical protein